MNTTGYQANPINTYIQPVMRTRKSKLAKWQFSGYGGSNMGFIITRMNRHKDMQEEDI